MKVFILGTSVQSILNFRKELIQCFIAKGIDVTAISSNSDYISLNKLGDMRVVFQKITLKRNGLNLIYDIKTFIEIFTLMRRVRPGFALAYGVKLVVWGGMAARISQVPFFALITGLGFAFHGDSFKRRLLTKMVTYLYKISLKNSKAVIFQNIDNRNVFVKKGIVPFSKTHVVNGSGVNTVKFSISNFPKVNTNFLCISRLLGEKGLREYAAAAKIVKKQFPDIEFVLVGSEDSSPDAISLTEVDSWSRYINYKGSTPNIKEYIKDCHVYVLPSYHEGLPKSTLEAMSMGRPILTTNAVGCKETVEDGVNGFLVPIGSATHLAEKMVWYIKNKDKIQAMGAESRKIVENKFDVKKINKKMLEILEIK